MIRKIGPQKYRLYSMTTGRILGTFRSRRAAVAREKQIQFFKKKG